MNEIPQQTAEPKKSTYKSSKVPYSRGDIKNWISFGINNGYVNKFKKDEIAKYSKPSNNLKTSGNYLYLEKRLK